MMKIDTVRLTKVFVPLSIAVIVHLCLGFSSLPSTECFPSSPSHHRRQLALHLNTPAYTIEYSPNFQRHIVRNVSTNEVWETFLWLDEALEKYPGAKPLPLQYPSFQNHSKDDCSLIVAGCCHNLYFYFTDSKNEDYNWNEITEIIESSLKWLPSQVKELIETVPELAFWPPKLLKERLDFFMAPLPPDDVLDAANWTSLDWPVQFYQHGYGAGMSIAQVSHAFKILPHLLLRLDPYSKADQAILPYLYSDTPAVVIQMASGQLPELQGASQVDVLGYSYLHWRGWDWKQMRVLMRAFPATVAVSLEPSWDIHAIRVRKQLILSSLWYLQLRLQLRPYHIHAMLRTHPMLSHYSTIRIQAIVDALESKLRFSSADLQQLLLWMPSLLGMSPQSLDKRIDFWTSRVGLSPTALRSAVLKHPALLQYSVQANMEPKLSFFRDELKILSPDIARMTTTQPKIWGRSLQRSLRVISESLCNACCDLTNANVGEILSAAPELALYNWKGNIEPKIEFITTRLGFNGLKLRKLLLSSPRILTLGSYRSLEAKVAMIESVAGRDTGRKILEKKPSILLNSASIIKKRLDRLESQNIEVLDGILNNAGRSVSISLLREDNRTVDRVFGNVASAAEFAGISKSHMYLCLKQEKPIDGRIYLKGNFPKAKADSIKKEKATFSRRSPIDIPVTGQLTIHVAGRAYPPERILRGRRRTGGLAIHIPSWKKDDWKSICTTLWKGQKYRLLPDGQTLLLGYPYTRPSRSRCTLYVCREAIRASTHWLSRNSFPATNIEIVLDSHSVFELVQNTTALFEWGKATSRDDFNYTGPLLIHQANPDILFPMSRTVHRFLARHRNVTVTFRREVLDNTTKRVGDGAMYAAKHMYETLKRY